MNRKEKDELREPPMNNKAENPKMQYEKELIIMFLKYMEDNYYKFSFYKQRDIDEFLKWKYGPTSKHH